MYLSVKSINRMQ